MVVWRRFFILIVTPDFHRGDESYYITKPASKELCRHVGNVE